MYSRLWIVSLLPIDPPPDEEGPREAGARLAEARLVDRASCHVDWMRFSGRPRFVVEVQTGDEVIQLWRPGGSTEVWPPARVLHIEGLSGPALPITYVYLEEQRHARWLPWGDFRRAAMRAGLRTISRGSLREVRSLHAAYALRGLWV